MAIQTVFQRKQIRNARWLLFWCILAEAVANLAVNALFSFFEFPEGEYLQYIQIALIELAAFLTAFIMYARSGISEKRVTPIKKELKLNRISTPICIIIVLLAIFGEFVMIAINIPVLLISGGSEPVTLTITDLLIGVFALAVLPALLEEFLFRGLLFGAFSNISDRAAIIFTTVMFVFLHRNPKGILGYLFMGLVLCVLLLKTKSLYAAMIYHFVSNLTALILDYTSFFAMHPSGLTLIFLITAIVFFTLLYIFVKATPKTRVSRDDGDGAMLIQSFASVPVIMCLIIMLFYERITSFLI